jgi:prepilin-type N-terminal cleavage/methylation domain-containing protein
MTRARDNTTPAAATRRGFTLVELLVVVGIIVLLVSLAVVGFSGVLGNARRASAQATVNTLGMGAEQFRIDHDDVPPLVTEVPGFDAPPPPGGGGLGGGGGGNAGEIRVPGMINDFTERREAYYDARYYSEWTLPIYLLGVGDINGDGINDYSDEGVPNRDDGVDGFGFRDPGPILAWKQRDPQVSDPDDPDFYVHAPINAGRVYGPYIDTGQLDAAIIDPNGEVQRSGALEAVPTNNGGRLYRFVDPWGTPIRYYRNYLTIDPNTDLASSAFMPQELRGITSAEEMVTAYRTGLPTDPAEMSSYAALDADVLAADFVILGAGEDASAYRDANGRPVAPFGDVTINVNRQRVPLPLRGSATMPQPFDPSMVFVEDDEVSLNTYLNMIRSNVRYVP